MKSVEIIGFPSHLIKEGNGYYVSYGRNNIHFNNRKHTLKKINDNSTKINLYLSLYSEEKRTLLDQSFDETFKEDNSYVIKPFHEKKEEFKDINRNYGIHRQKYSYYDGNKEFLKLDKRSFNDLEKFDIKDFVMLSEDDIQNYIYPFTFNNSSYHRRGGAIRLFDTINKIKFYDMGPDKVKGFRGFATNHGVNALKENNKVNDYFIKKDNEQVFFEDGILENYIYNKNKKRKIKKVNYSYDPITKDFTSSFEFIDEIIMSNEPRYFNLNTQFISPYKDYNTDINNPYLKNDPNNNLSVLTDSNLNNILLNSGHLFNRIQEEKIFASAGRSINYSQNINRESLVFYESLD